MIVSFVWRLITIRELSWVLKENLIVIRELIIALYVWFWYLKIDYHPLVGLPKKKSITTCEFIVLPNKRWVCPASGRGANKKPTKLGGGREDEKKQGRWDEN